MAKDPGSRPQTRARAGPRPAGGRAGAAPAAHPGGRARRAGSHGARRGLGGAPRARPRPHQRPHPRLARRTRARAHADRAAEADDVDDGPPTISGGPDPRAWWGCSSSAWSARWCGRSAATTARAHADGGGPLADRRADAGGRLPRAARHRRAPRGRRGHLHVELRRVRRRATSSGCGSPTARRPSSTRASPPCRAGRGTPSRHAPVRWSVRRSRVSRKSGVAGPLSAIRCQTAG